MYSGRPFVYAGVTCICPSCHTPVMSGYIHTLTMSGYMHTPTMSGYIHTPTMSGYMHMPTLSGYMHTPTVSGYMYTPTMSGYMHTPTMSRYIHLLYPCARTNYEYWTRVGGAVFMRIPALFDVTRCALLCRRHKKPEEWPIDGFSLPIFAYFRVLLRYFRVNSVEKS